MLDPTPPGDLPSVEEVLEFFIRRNWFIEQDPRSFLLSDGTLDAARVLRGARAAGMLDVFASESDVRESWSIYMANRTLLKGYRVRRLPDRAAWLLRADQPALDGAFEGGLRPLGCGGPWAAATTPERCYGLVADHVELMQPANAHAIARWMVEMASDHATRP